MSSSIGYSYNVTNYCNNRKKREFQTVDMQHILLFPATDVVNYNNYYYDLLICVAHVCKG